MAITLPPELETTLKARAAEQGMSVEDFVREALTSIAQPNGSGNSPIAQTDQATEGKSDDYFADEMAVYERHRTELERDHMGKTALIHGDELVGIYSSPEAACQAAYRRYGYFDKFMVYEIGEPVYEVLPGIM